MKIITQNQIDRHKAFCDHALKKTNDIDRGRHWVQHSPLHGVSLTHHGFEKRGGNCYLPKFYSNDTDTHNSSCAKYIENRFKTTLHDYLEINDTRFELSLNTIKPLYFYLLLSSYSMLPQSAKVLEIGGGAGVFGSLLIDRSNSTYINVDIPEMLIESAAFFLYNFPEKNIILPNEIESVEQADSADILLLYPTQLSYIPDSSCTLAVNMDSMMEMTYGEVEKYFRVLYNALHDDGIFLCCNRRKKRTELFKYPWTEYRFRDVFIECQFDFRDVCVGQNRWSDLHYTRAVRKVSRDDQAYLIENAFSESLFGHSSPSTYKNTLKTIARHITKLSN